MLILPYTPNSPKVIATTGTITASAAFDSILSLSLYRFYRNRGSKYVTRQGTRVL